MSEGGSREVFLSQIPLPVLASSARRTGPRQGPRTALPRNSQASFRECIFSSTCTTSQPGVRRRTVHCSVSVAKKPVTHEVLTKGVTDAILSKAKS